MPRVKKPISERKSIASKLNMDYATAAQSKKYKVREEEDDVLHKKYNEWDSYSTDSESDSAADDEMPDCVRVSNRDAADTPTPAPSPTNANAPVSVPLTGDTTDANKLMARLQLAEEKIKRNKAKNKTLKKKYKSVKKAVKSTPRAGNTDRASNTGTTEHKEDSSPAPKLYALI